jgi:hypothetical protein
MKIVLGRQEGKAPVVVGVHAKSGSASKLANKLLPCVQDANWIRTYARPLRNGAPISLEEAGRMKFPACFTDVPNIHMRMAALRRAVAEISAAAPIRITADGKKLDNTSVPAGWKSRRIRNGKLVIENDRFVFKTNGLHRKECGKGFDHNLRDVIAPLFVADHSAARDAPMFDLLVLNSEIFSVDVQHTERPENWKNCTQFAGFIQERVRGSKLFKAYEAEGVHQGWSWATRSCATDRFFRTQQRWADFIFAHALAVEDLQFLLKENGDTVLFDTGFTQHLDQNQKPARCNAETRGSCGCKAVGGDVLRWLVPLLLFKLQEAYAALGFPAGNHSQLRSQPEIEHCTSSPSAPCFSDVLAQFNCPSLQCGEGAAAGDGRARKRTGCVYSALPAIDPAVEGALKADATWVALVGTYKKIVDVQPGAAPLHCSNTFKVMEDYCSKDNAGGNVVQCLDNRKLVSLMQADAGEAWWHRLPENPRLQTHSIKMAVTGDPIQGLKSQIMPLEKGIIRLADESGRLCTDFDHLGWGHSG